MRFVQLLAPGAKMASYGCALNRAQIKESSNDTSCTELYTKMPPTEPEQWAVLFRTAYSNWQKFFAISDKGSSQHLKRLNWTCLGVNPFAKRRCSAEVVRRPLIPIHSPVTLADREPRRLSMES